MKTYKLEFTAEQLKLVSEALMSYEFAMVQAGKDTDEDFSDTFLKVSDALNQMYDDQGVES